MAGKKIETVSDLKNMLSFFKDDAKVQVSVRSYYKQYSIEQLPVFSVDTSFGCCTLHVSLSEEIIVRAKDKNKTILV